MLDDTVSYRGLLGNFRVADPIRLSIKQQLHVSYGSTGASADSFERIDDYTYTHTYTMYIDIPPIHPVYIKTYIYCTDI